MSKRQLREPTSSSTRQPFSSLECEPTDCNGREKAFYGRVNDKRMARNSIHIEKYRPKDTFYHTSKPKSELIPPQEHPLLSTPSRQKENATRGYEPRYWGQGEPSMTSSAPSLRDIGYKEEQGAWSPGSDIERSYNTHKVLSNRVRPAMDADDEERDRKRDFKAGKIKEKNRYLSMDEARKIIDRDENFNKVMKSHDTTMQATAQAALSSRKAHFHKYVGHDPDTSVTEGHVEAIAWDGRAVAKYQRLEAKHKRLGWPNGDCKERQEKRP